MKVENKYLFVQKVWKIIIDGFKEFCIQVYFYTVTFMESQHTSFHKTFIINAHIIQH
jgi:hypothetical protein